MSRLTAILCLTLALLLGSAGEGLSEIVIKKYAGESLALPPCPEDQSERYHNCYGTYVWDDGQKYIGEWKDDERHGQGTLTFDAPHKNAGEKYVGEWKDDKRHGQGALTWADGSKYVGEWKDDKQHGQGTQRYDAPHKSAGTKYVGEFKNYERNGQGTVTWANGSKYVGEWKDDKSHGYGIEYEPDGTVSKQGYWEYGELVRSTIEDEKEEPKYATSFQKGLAAYKNGDYATALREFKPLAEQGDANAQYYLGEMYETGQGIPQDDKTAVKWYRLSAEQGYARAQTILGLMYDKGQGVSQDYRTAVKWYRRAAEQGNTDARIYLEYLEKTIAEQKPSLTVAAEKSSTSSSGDFQKGLDAFKRYDFVTALREFKPLAEQGHADAQFYLGSIYEYGDGVPQNDKTAVKWYRLAAEQGLGNAQHNLGWMYEYGQGVSQDDKTAVKWYRLAAEQGDSIAQHKVKTLQEMIAQQQSSPTVTAEKPKPKVDQQQRLELARRTQEALQVLGLYSGKLDGIIGVNTRSAIQRWQKRNGYAGTGEITEVQLAKLEQEAITQLAEKKLEAKKKTVAESAQLQNMLEKRLLEMTALKEVIAEFAEKEAEAKAKKKPELAVIPSIEFGDYHALVIGNNDYPHMNNLENAVQDAKDVSSVLERMYGFEVTTLMNATRSEIFGALESFRTELTSDSNLLIYYAGHGYIDVITGTGYWQPVDSDEISKSNWIPNSVVTNELKAIRAKHVLVIADSCYSGTLVRSSTKGRPTAKDTEWYKRMAEKRSRTAIVSGGIEPVMDGGGGKNSVFAKALLGVLRDNQSIMDGAEVFERLKRPVILAASEQTPKYADIRLAGPYEDGRFLFVRTDAITEQSDVSDGADALERAKKQCSELGFTMGKVEHGKCVLSVMKILQQDR